MPNSTTLYRFTHIISLGLLLIMAVPVLASGQLDHAAPANMHQAEKQLKSGNPEQALKTLKRTEKHRTSLSAQAYAQSIECRAWLALKEGVQAQQACMSAIALTPGRAQWGDHNNLGIAKLYQGNLEGAMLEFRIALRMSQGEKAVRRNLNVVLRKKREEMSSQLDIQN